MLHPLHRLKQALATQAYRRRIRTYGVVAAVEPYHGARIPRPRRESDQEQPGRHRHP